jgi:hypothetical protein
MAEDLVRKYTVHNDYMKAKRAQAKLDGICTSCFKDQAKSGKSQCPKCIDYQRRYAREAKRIVINAYGGKCACCGESGIEFLQIDHIDGWGAEHRRTLKKDGVAFYRWLCKNHFPKGFQVLCANCNSAKGIQAECPHKAQELKMLKALARIPMTY